MKTLNNYIVEKLNINKSKLKNGPECTLFPETMEELADMIKKEIEQNGNKCSLNHIDTNKITDMSFLFSKGAKFDLGNFNGDMSNWDVSNVTNMKYMFAHSNFNRDISDWDVSNVKDMDSMFEYSAFNGDLSKWDISKVKDMGSMFENSDFNNDSICNWDVSNVGNMMSMFRQSPFNHDISNWQVNPKCLTSNIFIGCAIKIEFEPKCLQ
jgi:surface protein